MLSSGSLEGPGFPLDDAWIHQTYARNLAERGEWSFVPGKPSGGSTAPLWSALLAGGHLLSSGTPFAWTYFLGLLGLIGLGLAGEGIFRRETGRGGWLPWAGIFLAGEWHLVWAAASGMETILYPFIVTAVLVLLLLVSHDYFRIGLLIGLSLWTRPDGMTLLGPASAKRRWPASCRCA